MSVVEDVEQDRGTVLQYAPRRVRFPADEQSILPILERLNRGEGDASLETWPEPRVPLPIETEPPRRRIGWQLVACSALSAGLSAGLAVLAIGWLAPGKSEFTRIDTIQLDPKAVHTVSFKQDPPAGKQEATPLAPSESDLHKQPPESAPPIQPKDEPPPVKPEAHNDQIAPKELLALWSGIPANMPASPMAEETDSAAAANEEGAGAEAEAPPAEAKPHRDERRHHARARHRRHYARAHVTRTEQPGQTATTPGAQEPASTPLQSAFQSLFGQSAPSTQQQSGASPPAPNGY